MAVNLLINYISDRTGQAHDNDDARIAALETQNLDLRITALENIIQTILANISSLLSTNYNLLTLINNQAITSGSDYIRLPDGTLICWGISSFTKDGAVGTLYRTVNFPVSFTTTPKVIASWCDNDATYTYFDYLIVYHGTESSSSFLVLGKRLHANYEWSFSWCAFGKWK